MTNITIGIAGAQENADTIRDALEDFEYSEVDSLSMTGLEGGVVWLVSAVLASPVVVKLLDLLDSKLKSESIDKVSISQDGSVVLEGASAKQAAKFLREMRSRES